MPLPADVVERTLAILDGVNPSGTASLQRDIAAGKRSELDEWTGAVVRLGARAGVPTPLHDFLYADVVAAGAARARRAHVLAPGA